MSQKFEILWEQDLEDGNVSDPGIPGAVYNPEDERWEISFESFQDLIKLAKDADANVSVEFPVDMDQSAGDLPLCILQN